MQKLHDSIDRVITSLEDLSTSLLRAMVAIATVPAPAPAPAGARRDSYVRYACARDEC